MMLNLAKIGQLAQDCSLQELHAAAIWQQRLHNFDGQAILWTLQRYRHFWSSFCFAPANEGTAQNTWGLEGIIETLLAMAAERATPSTRGTRCAPYLVSTLYVLAANQDTFVAPLLSLGERWRADDVAIHTAICPCGVYSKAALQDAALDERRESLQEAVVLAYSWRHDTLLNHIAPNTSIEVGVGVADDDRNQGSGKRARRGGAHKDAKRASTQDKRQSTPAKKGR